MTELDVPQRIVVTDVKIPFLSLVVLLVKIALAAIPAAIILWLVWMVTLQLIAAAGRPSVTHTATEYVPPESAPGPSPSRSYIAPPPLNPGPPPAQVKAADAIKQAQELLRERKWFPAYVAAHRGQSDPDATRDQRRELQDIADEARRGQ
jgi:hypothetical protein